MRIYLIGLPGCGKTTIAKVLSEKLNYKYVDMDVAIEARENKAINAIFKENGEPYFRQLEAKLLVDLAKIDDVVIACGGGVVENNLKFAFKGLVIFLKVDLDVLEKRLANDETRPLLKRNSIYQLALRRNELYTAISDITIDNNGVEETVNKILEAIQNENINS